MLQIQSICNINLLISTEIEWLKLSCWYVTGLISKGFTQPSIFKIPLLIAHTNEIPAYIKCNENININCEIIICNPYLEKVCVVAQHQLKSYFGSRRTRNAVIFIQRGFSNRYYYCVHLKLLITNLYKFIFNCFQLREAYIYWFITITYILNMIVHWF